MLLKNKFALLVLAGLAMMALAHAEEEGALGMKVGAGSRLLLGLETGALYTNNAFYQEDDEESAVALVVKPTATLLLDRGSARWQFISALEAAGFNLEGDADDYVDGVVSGAFDWQPLTRHGLQGAASWAFDHDSFGTRRTEALGTTTSDLDEWEQKAANLVYRFGASEAKINLEGELLHSDREYTTNRAFTQFLDHDTTGVRGTAFYRISSKTQLLAEIIKLDIDYDHVTPGVPSRAGELVRYRVGAKWQATGNTVGDIRVGRIVREFDSAANDDFKEMDWRMSVSWTPRVRDKITITTGREPEESYLTAATLIDNQYFTAGWLHDWSSKVSTTARYRFNDLDYIGSDRQDDLNTYSFEIEYRPATRWSTFAELRQNNRDSNAILRDYEATSFLTGIRLTY